MKIPYLTFIIFLFVFAGCKSTQHLNNNTITGYYAWGIYQEEGSLLETYIKNLYLKEDSTFTYISTEGLDHSKSQGIWHCNGKYIYLNSDPKKIEVNLPKKDTIMFLVCKAELTESNFTTIRIIKQDSTPQRFATCKVKFKKTYQWSINDDTGTYYFTLNPVELMEIIAPGMNAIKFYNTDLKANNFEFIMLPSKITYENFENKELKIQKGRLYDKSIKKNNWIKKDYFEKLE